ncbi:large repetitive protein [Cystobacter fuscus]|uniref:Large repetitive protein n=1 Tax=Cystobacter fuscus TaxID=43 RepID=A0A250IWA3_9BACT|nr:Ig-like domain-containing protein [Cystobacter fuscus]ATB35487.1 large repetitive protein [Cystobacter fuscus]
MKNTLFTKWLAAALWVLALGSTAALAEPDTFYLGDGHNGAFRAGSESIVNSYAQVVSPLLEGDTEISVTACTASPCFAGGELVMVFQTTGFLGTPPQIEDPAPPTSLNSTEVGRWELARVDSVSGTTLKLKAPLVRGYAAQVTQVIRVPEFTEVNVGPEDSIIAKPWDGKVGGVLAFLSTGNVRNLGMISTDGAGFRGGVFVGDSGGSGSTGCSGDEESAPKGAQKGEGIANTYHGPGHTGRGYILNGGGGGVCLRSGGGGGANHGKGGMGGFSSFTDGSRSVGGRAGAPIRDYSLLQRFVPGGGGGAGHGSPASVPRGGSGGGVLFIRALSLSGTGSLLATGSSGYFSNTEAGGGGGAGGSIHLRLATSAVCGDIDASGGNGGSPNTKQVGPGGGGGGGVVLLQAANGAGCVADSSSVLGGLSGSQKDTSAPVGVSYGAERGAGGRVETIDRGFVMPNVPTVSAPANGTSTNSAHPNVTGTATPNTIVVIYIDGKEASRGISNAAGGYVVALLDALTEGAHSVQAATELDGVQSLKSTANAFTVDTLRPEAPVVTVPGEGDFVSTLRPVIQGTAEANSTVTVYLDNRPPVTVTASGTGDWTYTPAFDLAQGGHTVKATATDTAGNVSPESNVRGFNVDTLAPAAPVVSTPAQGSHSNNKLPVITGTAEANATVTVYLDGSVVGTAPVDGAGAWSFTTAELTDGTYTVKVTATDAAGNVSPESNTRTFTIDTQAPAAPVVSTPTEGSYVTTPVIITGRAEAGSTVTVLIDGVPVGLVTANASGEWTYEASAVLEGPREVKVTATDAANNTSAESNTRTFIVDATAPLAPVVSTPADGAFVNTRTPVITGTAEADTTVTVYLNGSSVGTAPVDGAGAWSFTTAELTDGGTYTVKVTATDAAGNISPESNTRTFHVDVTVPVAPVITAPADGAFVNTRTPVITGTAEANTTVTVYLDGSSVGTAPVDALGAWSFTTAELTDGGTYTVKVTATDAAGNISPESNTRTFHVDVTVPVAPVITAPADGALVNTRVNVITGTAEANTTVTVYLDGSSVGTVPVDASGAWSFTTAELTDGGTYAVKVTATDAAGNISPESSTHTFRVDATAPVAPVITAPADGAFVNTRTPVITGTAEANTTVTVYLNGSSVGTAPVDGAGNWSFTTAELTDGGTYAVKVTATDAAGNISPESNTRTFHVDVTVPVAPVVIAPDEGSLFNTRTPAISGTAEAGTTVTVYLNGSAVGTAPVNTLGNWSFTTAELPDGTYTVKVTATDVAGNVSPESNTRAFRVDVTAPPAPVITAPADGALVNTRVNVITGTAEANTTVTVYLNGSAVGTAPVNGTGAWSFTTAELANGTYAVKVTTTDAAGNISPESNTRTFRVDATAPPAPVITAPAEGALVNTRINIIMGTAEVGTWVTVYINGSSVGTAPVDSVGNWSFRTAQLADGTYAVTAYATDAAGNDSPVAPERHFTVDASAPETFIVTHPPESSPTTDAAFTFRAEDASFPVTYQCTLDGQSIACTESLALIVSEGKHTLTVSAVDALGNRDATPASFSWTVDTVAPEAPVVVAPAEGAALESNSPVVISGTAEPDSTVMLLLDGQEIVVKANAAGEWSYSASGLAPGPYQVTARARDAAGNVGPESAPRSFTVLDSARVPDTEISSGPSGTTAERDATFTFGSEQGVSFECSLDGAEFAPCTSPVTYTDLAEGEHTFQVRARDARGIVDDTPASRTWTVGEADIAYLGGGFGCSASGGDSSLVLMALGSLLAMARRRRAAH